VPGGIETRFLGRPDPIIVTLSTTSLLLRRGNYRYVLIVDAIRGDLLHLLPVKYMLNIFVPANDSPFCVTFITRWSSLVPMA